MDFVGIWHIYKMEQWDKDYFRKEWFNMPLVTTYARKKAETSGLVKVAEIPLATFYTNTWSTKHRKIRFIDLFLATAYERSTKENVRDRWAILHSPLFSLANKKTRGDHQRLKVLEAPPILPDCLSFTVLDKIKNKDDNRS